jgi:hypothetical protein
MTPILAHHPTGNQVTAYGTANGLVRPQPLIFVGYVREPLNARQEKNPKIEATGEVVTGLSRPSPPLRFMGRISQCREGSQGDSPAVEQTY